MRTHTLSMLATTSVLLACSHAQTTPAERWSPADFYPLAVGNAWTYVGSFLGQGFEKTITISSKEGEYFKDDAGSALLVDAFGLRDSKRYLLQRPLVRGTAWKSVVAVGSTETYEVAETEQRVVTLAGTFDGCVVVRSRNRQDASTELVNEMTYAPGVGMVRIAMSAVVNGKTIPQSGMELKAFKLAGGKAPPPAPK